MWFVFLLVLVWSFFFFFFFFNDTATTEIYTLSLHDALPIYATKGEIGLDAVDGFVAVMEHRRREHGVCAGAERLRHVLALANPARRDHRHPHRTEHRPQELQVRAGARPVAIPAREQDLPGPEAYSFPRPPHGVGPAVLAAAVRECLPAVARTARIDGEHHALAAKLGREF